MGFRICLPLFSTSRISRKWICFDIPVHFDPFWKLHWPGPLIDGKTPKWAADASALATIRTLIPAVGKDVARHLEAASEGLLQSLKKQLPEGAETSFTKNVRTRGG